MDLVTPSVAALAFLPFVIPIGLYIAWSDMKYMKIPNPAVLALVAVFLVVGPFVLPLADWGWRWTHLAVVLVIGFLATLTGGMGAGDAKFAAAAAPFVARADLAPMALVFAAILLAAFVAHRTVRRMPAVTEATPDWKSWTDKRFPMGLALGPALIAYLALAAIYGA